MKRFILPLCAVLISACSNNTKNEFTISGKFENISDSTIVYLLRSNNGRAASTVAMDTITANNCSFSATDTAASNDVTRYLISVCDLESLKNGNYHNSFKDREIYGRAGMNVVVTGDFNDVDNWTIKNNLPEQKTLEYINNATRECRNKQHEEIKAIDLEIEAAIKAKDREAYNKANEKLHQKSIVWTTESTLIYMSVIDKLETIDIAALHKIPVYSAVDDTCAIDHYRSVYNKLTDEQKQTAKGRKICKRIGKNITLNVGDKITDATLFDFDGNRRQLYDLLTKPLLIDFWSTGCGPCHMIAPILEEMATDSSINANIISINIDEESTWVRGTESLNLESSRNFTDKLEDAGLFTDFAANGMPFFVIVDTDGTIKYKQLGFNQETITKILNDLQK